ncbi:malate:quinone oxidoreductase, partial [Staphylococcus epidermidis]|uniref:malate:quinone oxidoreductase n=1 Tax=Staphylococcus epidermidis TaxID=1282 RepID=UPI0016432F2E
QTVLPHYVFIPPPARPIPLLQKTPIPQTKHLPPFPITPHFLISTNPHLINQHHLKLYPKQPPPTPPITLPHLHTPYIDAERTLLFAPFANIPP